MARWLRILPTRSLVVTLAAVAAGSGGIGGSAHAAAGGSFLAHQALYELSLVKSRGSNSTGVDQDSNQACFSSLSIP